MPTDATVRKDQRLPVRLFNGTSRVLGRLGRRKPGFVASLDVLHATAAKAVGHDDFGDRVYLQGLRVLAEAYDHESRLSPFGRTMVEAQLLGILKNRLIAERHWKNDPAILAGEVRRPIFVMGLPRTGTTALHHLLGQDPDNQVLEYWLAESPAPRPARERWEGHPNYKQSLRNLRTMYWLDPDLKAIHLMTADGAEECRHLLQQNFTDDTFDCNANIPSYSQWYGRCDMRPTYRRHRDLLKLIGSTGPQRRWLLKYPVHMGNLDVLLEVYPDACIVQTHRDPAKVLPSICSLVAGWRAIYEDTIDRLAIARWQLELWASRLERFLEVRSRSAAARFFDLSFREIVEDPTNAIRRMYQHFGLPMTERAERAIAAHASTNPRGKHGEHRYTATDFQLTDGWMHERFAPYMKHFAVAAEAATA